MIATCCSNHLPLRNYFPKIIILSNQVILFPKFWKPTLLILYFDHKTTSSFIKDFQIIFSIEIGNVCGILYHFTQNNFYKIIPLVLFSFWQNAWLWYLYHFLHFLLI
jgi:hypothetical protein